MTNGLSRRQILQLLGVGVGASLVGVGCSGGDGEDTGDSESAVDAAERRRMLMDIDHFVILMQENRSFDHFMGGLQRDRKYANRKDVNGTTGREFNPAPNGDKVEIHRASTFTLHDPPHSFVKSHEQYNGGRNDGFVQAHKGEYQRQVMAYYDRDQIPFYYWLADKFTLADNWHASVMGPTMPNRLYLHCGTSAGVKINDPITSGEPKTIWEHLAEAGKTAVNYHAGSAALVTHALPNKAKAGKIPTAKIADFFAAAKNGTLPSVSYIDPDYHVNCDHPVHDIRLGQAFVQSVYQALSQGPAWGKTLFLVCYDEHGGFWDHVAPAEATDHYADFRRYGFRVPAMISGGTVKRGHLLSKRFDHTSVLATLSMRFGLPALSKRAAHANPLTDVFDVALSGGGSAGTATGTGTGTGGSGTGGSGTGGSAGSGTSAPADPPPPVVLNPAVMHTIGPTSQHELERSIHRGIVPRAMVDDRSPEERTDAWLRIAEDLGAVTYVASGD
jgi:phospholipase C